MGNNMKALHLSVAASLKKLRTDYIDILYVHWVSIRFETCVRIALTTRTGSGTLTQPWRRS